MEALQFRFSPLRYAFAKAVGTVYPAVFTSRAGCLAYGDVPEPALPPLPLPPEPPTPPVAPPLPPASSVPPVPATLPVMPAAPPGDGCSALPPTPVSPSRASKS